MSKSIFELLQEAKQAEKTEAAKKRQEIIENAEVAEHDAEVSGEADDWWNAARLWREAGDNTRFLLCAGMARERERASTL